MGGATAGMFPPPVGDADNAALMRELQDAARELSDTATSLAREHPNSHRVNQQIERLRRVVNQTQAVVRCAPMVLEEVPASCAADGSFRSLPTEFGDLLYDSPSARERRTHSRLPLEPEPDPLSAGLQGLCNALHVPVGHKMRLAVPVIPYSVEEPQSPPRSASAEWGATRHRNYNPVVEAALADSLPVGCSGAAPMYPLKLANQARPRISINALPPKPAFAHLANRTVGEQLRIAPYPKTLTDNQIERKIMNWLSTN